MLYILTSYLTTTTTTLYLYIYIVSSSLNKMAKSTGKVKTATGQQETCKKHSPVSCDEHMTNSHNIDNKKASHRRRRNKKDVILDFRKHARKKINLSGQQKQQQQTATESSIKISDKTKKAKKGKLDKDHTLARLEASRVVKVASEYKAPEKRKKSNRNSDKLNLSTGSKDYDGNVGLPEKVSQRKFESTGQFFRRLDRLVAKARVEANLETRFDMTLNRSKQEAKSSGKTKKLGD